MGAPFSEEELETLTAAVIYATAYMARCECTLDYPQDVENSFRSIFSVHAKARFQSMVSPA